jgi:hypothetical protein
MLQIRNLILSAKEFFQVEVLLQEHEKEEFLILIMNDFSFQHELENVSNTLCSISIIIILYFCSIHC